MTRNKIAEMGWSLVQQPPYSPDAALCDYGLSATMKRPLKDKRYVTDEEVQTAVKKSLKDIDVTSYLQIDPCADEPTRKDY